MKPPAQPWSVASENAGASRPPYAAVIFDLDGVLVDTAEYHYLAWKRIADEIGVPFDRRKNERLRGVPRGRSLEILIEDMPRPPADLETLAERKNRWYVEMIGRLTPADLLPGAERLLLALKRGKIRMAVGSSSKNARAVLERVGLANAFDAIVDGYGFERAKPAPDIFLNAAQLLDATPAQCVVVEDAAAGIQAAKAAGMFAVGVARGEPLPGADLLVRSVAEIPLSLWGLPEEDHSSHRERP